MTDERRGIGEQDAFEGILLLEKVEQCKSVLENDCNGLGIENRKKEYLILCSDTHHELVMRGWYTLLCRREC